MQPEEKLAAEMVEIVPIYDRFKSCPDCFKADRPIVGEAQYFGMKADIVECPSCHLQVVVLRSEYFLEG